MRPFTTRHGSPAPPPRYDGYQEGFSLHPSRRGSDGGHDGYQEGFSLHPSRRGPSGRPIRLNHSSNGSPRPRYPPHDQHSRGPRPIRGPGPIRGRGPRLIRGPRPMRGPRPVRGTLPSRFLGPSPRGPRPTRGPPPRQYRPPPNRPTYGYHEEGYNEGSQFNDEQFADPYDLSGDWEDHEMTATNDLKLVTPKSDAYGEWKVASEPIVKNKELDDWVPASKKTRIDEEQKEDAYVASHQYELWRRTKGVGVKGGVGTKRKLSKIGSEFTAAGKHPIGALKEKCPTCVFNEEDRERNDELKYWKLTASVTFTGYKFLGYGVTMKIAKANAAIKALTFLDVDGLHQMADHICSDVYAQKQQLLLSVMEEEQEETSKEEPWYIKVDSEANATPVFKPKAAPTPDSQPVMFLRQWYGPDVQVEFGIENPGFRPEIYSCIITVQGTAFEGNGRSKKEAQKMTAALTLQKLDSNPPPIDNRILKRAKKRKTKKKSVSLSAPGERPTASATSAETATNLAATSQPLVSAATTKILTTTSTASTTYTISSLAKPTSGTKLSSNSGIKPSSNSGIKLSSNSYYASSQYYQNYWNNQAQSPCPSPYNNTNTNTYETGYSTNTSTYNAGYSTNTSTYGAGYDYSSWYGTGCGGGWGTYQYPPVPNYSVPTPPPPPP